MANLASSAAAYHGGEAAAMYDELMEAMQSAAEREAADEAADAAAMQVLEQQRAERARLAAAGLAQTM